MLHVDDTLEDNRIIATREKEGLWKGIIVDLPTCKTARIAWSDKQMGAVMALAHGLGEESDFPKAAIDSLYEVAEPLFEANEDTGMCRETRLIP